MLPLFPERISGRPILCPNLKIPAQISANFHFGLVKPNNCAIIYLRLAPPLRRFFSTPGRYYYVSITSIAFPLK
jgi:hypothetical protein